MTAPPGHPRSRAFGGARVTAPLAALLLFAAPATWWARTPAADSLVAAADAGSLVQLAQRVGERPAEPATGSPAPSEPKFAPSAEEAKAASGGCVTCHTKVDSETMHPDRPEVQLGCTHCHGGNVDARLPSGVTAESPEGERVKTAAHVQPRRPELWKGGANPTRSYVQLRDESDDFIRFVNPGDLRAAPRSCGQNGCHRTEVAQVPKSMMATGPMLWAAAYYNNGSFPLKTPRFGESYGERGEPRRVYTNPAPTVDEINRGVLWFLDPLPRFEIVQPGNVLRVFERGQQRQLELGVPTLDEPPGRPANRLSPRGFGTLNRTDPVGVSLQRTRLLDPMLSLMGTNDHPGDYRSSGCSACHVIYANDPSPVHSGPYAEAGNLGRSQSVDPMIKKNQSGHPIKHAFTRAIPSSQCVVCHHHPGTTVTNSYYGYTWWDNETDGSRMYPETERRLSAREIDAIQQRNPEGAALRGKWSDPAFFGSIKELNTKLTRTRLAEFHGHGWLFRAVYKQDRKGQLLDAANEVVRHDDPDRFTKAVHLKDIHLERGMHCVDCHFKQDAHGDGKLYGETRAAVEITCTDCHGTIQGRATLRTSGPAAPPGGRDLVDNLTTPFSSWRFKWEGDTLWQHSMVSKKEWKVPQVVDTINPDSAWANEFPDRRERAIRSQFAKTLRRNNREWGLPVAKGAEFRELAHADSRMTCQSCHTAWVTSCFGCHLPMKANEKKPMLHNEGDAQRNWTPYNFQTLRDDVFMLAVDGTNIVPRTDGKPRHLTDDGKPLQRISPARSSCAVLVGSQNANREWIYSQQQTVSAEGLAGHAFSTFVPHTVRATETKTCTDCHVSVQDDNNAWMAQLLMHGTNFYNFIGRYAYVAEGRQGFEAVVVTEQDEPQAVIGSTLHRVAYPSNHAAHAKGGGVLRTALHHRGRDVLDLFGRDEVLGIQLRGEYLYTANGPGGFRAYDVAQIDQKGFSERLVTAPVSPLGQRLYVKTKYATAVAAPTTLAVDPSRTRRDENQEQKIHALYGYVYVTDRDEGLVVIGNRAGSPHGAGVATLLDGDPTNNFLERATQFNPEGRLKGAVNLAIAGRHAYVLAAAGLVVVDLDNPLRPEIVGQVGTPDLVEPRAIAVQFRYAFVTDRDGVKVIDVTTPKQPRIVKDARGDVVVVRLTDARGLTVARTYAYVAAGRQGLAIIDVERPRQPALVETYDAGGVMNDARDVKIGMTNASLFAYVADGRNGLRVVQLTSPEFSVLGKHAKETPEYLGFSPRPAPQLIATRPTKGHALALSKGTDRDRAVDESGNQIAVFNRLGSRPFTLSEMRRMYLQQDTLYTVRNVPPGPPMAPVREEKKEEPAPPPDPGRRRR